MAGARFTWKVKGEDTGYAFSIYKQELEPGEGVPLHCHAYGEVFYVLSGHIDFLQVTDAGEDWMTCADGETIIIPINALHAFYNRTDRPARLLSISTQLHQAFFDAVEETDRANPFASMREASDGAHRRAARRFDMHFFEFSPPTLADGSSAETKSENPEVIPLWTSKSPSTRTRVIRRNYLWLLDILSGWKGTGLMGLCSPKPQPLPAAGVRGKRGMGG